MKRGTAVSLPFLVLCMSSALADDIQPAAIDLIGQYAGQWQVSDAEASRVCDVPLETGETIGGYVIDVADGCAKTSPVMGEIAAWWMLDNGDIVFVDATRRERRHLHTPDNRYMSG